MTNNFLPETIVEKRALLPEEGVEKEELEEAVESVEGSEEAGKEIYEAVKKLSEKGIPALLPAKARKEDMGVTQTLPDGAYRGLSDTLITRKIQSTAHEIIHTTQEAIAAGQYTEKDYEDYKEILSSLQKTQQTVDPNILPDKATALKYAAAMEKGKEEAVKKEIKGINQEFQLELSEFNEKAEKSSEAVEYGKRTRIEKKHKEKLEENAEKYIEKLEDYNPRIAARVKFQEMEKEEIGIRIDKELHAYLYNFLEEQDTHEPVNMGTYIHQHLHSTFRDYNTEGMGEKIDKKVSEAKTVYKSHIEGGESPEEAVVGMINQHYEELSKISV